MVPASAGGDAHKARRDRLPGNLDQIAAYEGIIKDSRRGFEIEEVLRKGQTFNAISVAWADASVRAGLLESYEKSGRSHHIICPEYRATNEYLCPKDEERIVASCAGTQSFIGICGSVNAFLKHLHSVQKVSGRLGSIKAVDTDQKALFYFERVAESYSEARELPFFYMEADRGFLYQNTFRDLNRHSRRAAEEYEYNIVKSDCGESKPRVLLEIKKYYQPEGTEVVLERGDIIEALRNVATAPTRTYIYASNVLSNPMEKDHFPIHLTSEQSIELIRTVENNKSFDDGTIIACFINEDTKKFYMLRKENGRIPLDELRSSH